MNHYQARNEARQHAAKHGVVMAVGLETDDDTGIVQFGYCPRSQVGPAFVYDVFEWVNPDGSIDRIVLDHEGRRRLLPIKLNPPSKEELEHGVIEAAIEFIDQARNGLYRSIPHYREALAKSVDALRAECDGEWRPE